MKKLNKEAWLNYKGENEFDEYLVSPFGVEDVIDPYFIAGNGLKEGSKDRPGIYLSLITRLEKNERMDYFFKDLEVAEYWLCIATRFRSSYFTIWKYDLEIVRDSDYEWLLDKWEKYKNR